MMRGVYFERHGKVKDVLKLGDIPKPLETDLAPGELLIQVYAGALNPAGTYILGFKIILFG